MNNDRFLVLLAACCKYRIRCAVGIWAIVGTLKFAMSQADRAIHRILAHVRDSCNDSALGNQMDDGSGLSYNKRAVIDFDMI